MTFALRILSIGMLTVWVCRSAHPAVVISAIETGGDVLVSYSGTLDLSGLTFSNQNATSDAHQFQNNSLTASAFVNAFATTDGGTFYSNPFSSTPSTDWVSATTVEADIFSGNHLALFTGGTSPDPLRLHSADVVGTTWSGAGFMQFNSTTLLGMGLDLSVDRVWTINNASADTITLTAIPEPGTPVFLGLFGTRLLFLRRRSPIVCKL